MRALSSVEHAILMDSTLDIWTEYDPRQLREVAAQGLITVEIQSDGAQEWDHFEATEAGLRALRVHAAYLGTLS